MKKKLRGSIRIRKQKETSGNKNEEVEEKEGESLCKKDKQGSICQFCDKKLRSRYQLRIHLAVHTGEKNYICGICKKGYQQKWNLITHVARVHSKEKPFKCNECGKAFGYSSHFKRHVKTHFLEKINASDAVKKIILNPHKCMHCEKSFESNYRLDLHVRTHSGARPYVCDKCGKSFTTKRLCDIHMKKHEIDVLMCEHCGETFSESKTMSWHLKTGHNIEEDFTPKIKGQKQFKKELVPCEVCGKTIMRSSVNKHLNIHYRNRVYLCRYCKKEFLESGQRKVHERKHTGEKPYICDICGRGHAQYGNLLTHRKRYHNLTKKTPRLWKRNQVSTLTNNSNSAKTKDEACLRASSNKEKIQANHSEFPEILNAAVPENSKPQYTGNETIQEFLKKASSWVNEKFQESKHRKDSGNQVPGKDQNPEFPDQDSESPELLENGEYKAKEQKIPPTKEIKKKLNNLIFDKILEDLLTTPVKEKVLQVVDTIQTNADVLREFLKKMKKVPDNIVMRTKNGALFWHCWICESKLKSRHLLARHLIIHEPEENRPYRCDVCNKTFTQSNNFKEHKMGHSNENQYYCPICWSGFRHKTHFNAHVKRHDPKAINSPPKKYECSYCDKKMHTKYQKKEHERTHTRERPFLCKVCGQQFGTSSTLHRHQFVHSNPTHQCEICLKLFKQKSGLKKHYDTHSKHPVKRISCDCGKTFSQKHSLKKHKMICKNRMEPVVKPFGCCICSKKFLTKSDLKRHVATHESVKRFTCPMCQSCLKTEETFKKHMRRHDDIQSENKKPVNDVETATS